MHPPGPADMMSDRLAQKAAAVRPRARGLHSSTFQLNGSAFCGMGGAFKDLLKGCLGGVCEVLGGIRRWLGCILCQKRLRLS